MSPPAAAGCKGEAGAGRRCGAGLLYNSGPLLSQLLQVLGDKVPECLVEDVAPPPLEPLLDFIKPVGELPAGP